MTSSAMNPITEDDIADFLLNTPDFFGAMRSCCRPCC
jgi:uncharacterized protein YigA (DUF484 family)